MVYLATFVSGLHEVVGAILDAYSVRNIRHMLDGAVVYENPHFINAGCFHNTFEVLHLGRQKRGSSVEELASEALARRNSLDLRALRSKRAQTFRIVSSCENQLVAVDAAKKSALETLIHEKTGLSLNRAKADVEFWLYTRSEGFGFLMKRISLNRVTEKQLQKGELHPELAFVLNWLSSPQKGDVYLDPFCGSGALPLARAKMSGFQRIFAFDIDAARAAEARRRFAALPAIDPKNITVGAADILDLPRRLPAGSVTKIVTDPPWGLFEKLDIAELYRNMLRVFAGIAGRGAAVVVLTARKEAFGAMLAECADIFQVKNVYHILVSGKKAAVFRLERR